MTHTASHIIISKATQTVSFGEDSKPGKVLLWHVVAALLTVGFWIGLATAMALSS